MRDYRSWLLIALGCFAGTSFAIAMLFAVQLRTRYENQLIQEIWPAKLIRPPVIIESQPNQDTVLMVGDSRISDWGGIILSNQTVVNAGQPGATTARLCLQLPDLLDKFRPVTVVIQAGVNDLKLIGMKPELESTIVAQAVDNLSNMVAQCSKRGCRVVLLGVWPVGRPEWLRRPVWNQEIPKALARLNGQLIELDDPSHKIYFFDIFQSTGLAQNQILFRGALHFQPAVYRRLTTELQRKIAGYPPN